MQIAARKLFKVANEIISIANLISNQPVMHMTMDASNITQSSTITVIKMINTMQFYLVKFNIKVI